MFAGAAAGLTFCAQSLSRAQPGPRFETTPFSLGVASGDPTQTSVVLWTRLAPIPLRADGGMPLRKIPVRWQLAVDEAVGKVVREGTVLAVPELGHSVHVELDALEPGREYWYRFLVGDEESPIGRTKTLPWIRADRPLKPVRFATASCQHYEQGFFIAYEQMIEDEVDFLIHLGDYIYDVSWGHDFRRHERSEPPVTLDQFRLRHALYKTDPWLQAAHAHLPFFVLPDNHDSLEYNDASRFDVRAAAYQAWYEHLPVRVSPRLGSAAMPIYGSFDLGNLVRVYLLDTRQFRDNQDVCRELADPDFGFGIYRPKCKVVGDPTRSMLGREQEKWLDRRLSDSEARWNVIASTVPFAPFNMSRDGRDHVYAGSWDFYPANRERVISAIRSHTVNNPIILSGDTHCSCAADVKEDPEDSTSESIAAEFVTTSISSAWPAPLAQPMSENLHNNPHYHLYDPTKRGYFLHEVGREEWKTSVRVVDSVRSKNATVSTLAAFIVENGKRGAQSTLRGVNS